MNEGHLLGSVVGLLSGRATDEARAAQAHTKVRGSWAKTSRMGRETAPPPPPAGGWEGDTLIYLQGRGREGEYL